MFLGVPHPQLCEFQEREAKGGDVDPGGGDLAGEVGWFA
jgi:hypothetical protein